MRKLIPFGVRDNRRRFRFVCVLAALVICAWTSRAGAQEPKNRVDMGVPGHYRPMIQGYLDQADAVIATYKNELHEGSDSNAYFPVATAREGIAESLGGLDAASAAFRDDPTLAVETYLNRADGAMLSAIDNIAAVYRALAVRRCQLMADRRYHQHIALEVASDSGASRDNLLILNRTQTEELLKDYQKMEDEFIGHFKSLVGDVWKLEDFNERRGRKESAAAFQRSVYINFCYNLDQPERAELRQRLFSAHPFEAAWLSPSRFFPIVTTGGLMGLDGETLDANDQTPKVGNGVWSMSSLLPKHPVESLRQFDSTQAPVDVSGNPIEGMARILTARLGRFFEVKADEDRLYGEIKMLVGNAGPVSAALPDTSNLVQALDAATEPIRVTRQAAPDRDQANQKYKDAQNATGAAQAALDNATAAAWGTVLRNGRTRRQAEDLLNQQIDNYQTMLNRHELDSDTVNRAQNSISEFKKQIAAIEADVATQIQPAKDALQKAKSDEDAARTARDQTLQRIATQHFDSRACDAAYAAAKGKYDEAVAALPSTAQNGLDQLPGHALDYTPDRGRAAVDRLRAAVDSVRSAIASLQQKQAAAKFELLTKVADLQRDEAELGSLAKVIASDKAQAINLVDDELSKLGDAEPDDLKKAMDQLKRDLKEQQEVLENQKKAVDALAWLNDQRAHGEIAKEYLSEMSERLETMTKAVKLTGQSVETITTLQTLKEQIDSGDPVQGLKALSTALEKSTAIAQYVPVIGPTVVRFVNFYAQAAGACSDGIYKIRAKLILIERESLLPVPAERHLYTLAEVKGILGNHDVNFDFEKITRGLQVRRLIVILHAQSKGDLIDRTR